MSKIKESIRVLDCGVEIHTFTQDVVNCNCLVVEAGTTGFMGGDTGHGGRTYFRIQDEFGTDINVRALGDSKSGSGFEVILGGDSELETMIQALKFVAQILEEKSQEVIN